MLMEKKMQNREKKAVLQHSNPSRRRRRVWGVTWETENCIALSELLRRQHCRKSSRRVWTVGSSKDESKSRREMLDQMYSSSNGPSRRVWTVVGDEDYIKIKSQILKLMYCSKPSSREVAASWTSKSLVERSLCAWSEQVLILRRRRQDHWSAVVHFKMRSLLKGLRALLENVDAEHTKKQLKELSVRSYHQCLKRKTIRGCKLLGDIKKGKLAKLEYIVAQRRASRLRDRFNRWYYATAIRSMRKILQQRSMKFRNKKLLLHALRAWPERNRRSREKEDLKAVQLTRIRGSLGKLKKLRIMDSWRSLQEEMNVKRLNNALALQYFTAVRAAPAVKALYVHMQDQKRKRSLLIKAAYFQRTRSCRLAMNTWIGHVLSRNLRRRAADHRRLRLLKLVMKSLFEWQQPHVEFKDMEEEEVIMDSGIPDIEGIFRILQRQRAKHGGHNSAGAAPQALRAQPRRPAYIYEDGAQPPLKPSSVLRHGTSSALRTTSPGKLPPREPHVVAKEIEWMEQVLENYQELKVQVVGLRAELALLLGDGTKRVDDGIDQACLKFHPQREQKVLELQQKIDSLEGQKTAQRPLIHAILSRVP